jgi:hypothetical protein
MLPSNSEVSTTPLKVLPRLVIGTAIPREAGDPASATAAVRKGSGARTRISEKYISSRTLLCLIGADKCPETEYSRDLGRYRGYFWGLYICGGICL